MRSTFPFGRRPLSTRHLSSIAALLVCLFASGAVLAGPPYVTDDPEPVDLHHWEVYLGSQYTDADDGRTETLPHVEVNYGAVPNVQLHVVAPFVSVHADGSPSEYGYGDTEVGVKYRFVQESDHRPQIGVFPLAELSTGNSDRGLGNGIAQFFLPVWLQKSWGPWTTYGGGGYWINPGEGNRNWIYTGWLLQRDISKALTLGGELFHRTPDTDGGESGSGFNLGGQVNFGDHYHFLFSAGKDFSGPNRYTQYLALQWTT